MSRQATKPGRKDFEIKEGPQVARSDNLVPNVAPGDAPPPHVGNSKEKLRQFVQATNPGPQKGATTGHIFSRTTSLDYAFISGLSISVAMFISPLATYLSHKVSHRFVLNLGTIFETLSLITTSFVKRNWQLFLSQGVCFGFGLGFCFVGSVGIISHWFDRRRSVANGIAAAGSGLGGMVYSLATSAMISNLGFPWAMRILGIICFAVNTVCGNLLRIRVSAASKQPELHFSLLRKPAYIAFLGWGALSAMAYIALLFSLSSYSVAVGLTQHQGSIATALLNLGQAIGRPAVGMLSDSLGRINIALIATFLAGFLSLVMWIFAQSMATIYAFAILVGLFSGTIWAAAPALGAEVVELSKLSSALCFLWFALAPPTSVAEAIALQLRGKVSGDKEYLRVQLFIGPDPQDGSSPPREKRQRVSVPNPAQNIRQESSRPWEFLLEEGHRVQYASSSNLLEPVEDETLARSPGPPISTADASSPKTNMNLNLGISTQAPDDYTDIAHYYPDATLALRLWTVYVNNVDPVLKVLHIPTTQSAMIATIADVKSGSPAMLALSFAIYFAAVTTLTNQEISELSSNDRQTLLHQYKTGLNQAVLKADYLNKPDLQILQALVIYITCLRIHDISRSVWVLVGIVIRLAQSIGIHRDGADLKLTPFEAELRIRLWWHICLLDSRSPEDHGYALTVDILNQDIRAPLNVDDDQLIPSMKSLPIESTAWTENTFSLIKLEAVRLLRPVLETGELNADTVLADIEAKRKSMSNHGKWIHDKFLSKVTPSSSLHKSACVHYENAWAKMEFMLQLREEMYLWGQKKQPSDWRRDPVKSAFHIACCTLESSFSLISGDISGHYMWIFHTHTQWYALAYVLRCLNVYGQSPEMTKGWALVEKCFKAKSTFRNPSSDLPAMGNSEGGSIWRCVLSLRQQALRLRNSRDGILNDEEIGSASLGPSITKEEAASRFTVKGQSYSSNASMELHVPRMPHQMTSSMSLDASTDVMGPSTRVVLPSETELEKYDTASLFTSAQAPELFGLPEWNDFINGNLDFLNGS
ncbi:conserved hypothetical protein [Paecilomyces variotii No. 5]|uniref:Xylanolytic transcriptional activator regulatory domain-containing protein n=1 Tax=Byssochlamys spectabilis (strain No. 5 / NBRC 109023) TaxID=1356009 RepID=V5FPF8_BYSSN|nr:conserved hypothetical protein [Paecilomyces variotii No. 5]